MSEAELKAIRERCEAATPAPWEWNTERFKGGYSGITGKDNTEVLFPNHCNDGDDGYAWFEDLPNDADAQFIAHAREDTPALLEEIESLKRQFEHKQRQLEWWADTANACASLYDEKKAELDRLKEANRWKNAESEPPKQYGHYIIVFYTGVVASARYLSSGHWKCEEEYYKSGFNGVTHWMPLPEPPKEDV